MTAAPLNGFNLPLALACSGLPANTTCAFSPASLSSSQNQSMLVVQTAAPAPVNSASRISGGAALLAALFGFLFVPRRFRRAAWISSILLAILASCPGCGGPAPITGGTQPGTYKVTVTAKTTAAGPQLSHSTTINLTVNSFF